MGVRPITGRTSLAQLPENKIVFVFVVHRQERCAFRVAVDASTGPRSRHFVDVRHKEIAMRPVLYPPVLAVTIRCGARYWHRRYGMRVRNEMVIVRNFTMTMILINENNNDNNTTTTRLY